MTDKIKKPETAKEILAILDEFLAQDNSQSAHAWDVISALRGPDREDDEKGYTIGIRRRALPKCAAAFGHGTSFFVGAFFFRTMVKNLPLNRDSLARGSRHFRHHLYLADEALTLMQIPREEEVEQNAEEE